MKKFISILFIVLSFPLLTACNNIDFSDKEILDTAYSKNRFPKDFYQEDLQGGSLYYETTEKSCGKTCTFRVPVCTNDKSQALEWSEASDKNSAYSRKLTEEKETEKYFEFKRVYEAYSSDIILDRVDKCSYMERSNFNMSDGEAVTKPVLNLRPITKENAKEFIEYLYFISNVNMSSKVILNTYIEDAGAIIKYTIYATDILGGDWGMCDQISVVTTEYDLNKKSGELTVTPQKQIKGPIRGNCYNEPEPTDSTDSFKFIGSQ